MLQKQKYYFLILIFIFSFKLNSKSQNLDSVNVDSIRKDAIKLFIDCNNCDLSSIKKNIKWVNYVRDTKDAHVHLLVTENSTNSGGTEFSMFFIGQNSFKGINDTIKICTSSDATDEEIRTILEKKLKIGLIRYVSKTPLIEYIDIEYKNEDKESFNVVDKWNSWLFSLSAQGNFNGQSSSSSFYFNSSVSANRTTEASKIYFSLGNSFQEQQFKYDGDIIIGTSQSIYFSHLYGKSINDHWSIGEYVNSNTSSYSNLDFAIGFEPTIEYNFYKYSEYNRRKLCLNYSVGPSFYDYIDTTVYFKTKEIVGRQNLSLTYQNIQKWGNIYLSIDGSTLLNDFTKNQLEFYTSIEWRIYKGLSVNWSLNYSIVRNQIGLPKGEASRDDVLLSIKQLQTNYSMWANFGISYSFGSIYNNVVNPRFN